MAKPHGSDQYDQMIYGKEGYIEGKYDLIMYFEFVNTSQVRNKIQV